MGLAYSAVFSQNGIWILGPVYTVEIREGDMESLLQAYSLSDQNMAALIDNLKNVPMVSTSSLFEKTIMLHRLLTGELTSISDLNYHRTEVRVHSQKKELAERSHVSYNVEKKLLDHVRQGNPDYKRSLSSAATKSTGTRLKRSDPIAQAKYSVTTFITLCSRAAIEGGLPADTAYTLFDTYMSTLC